MMLTAQQQAALYFARKRRRAAWTEAHDIALASLEVEGGLGHALISFTPSSNTDAATVDFYRVASGSAFNPEDETPIASVATVPSEPGTYTDGDDSTVDLVTNGGFDADTTWTKGTGWTIANGVATHSAASASGTLSQLVGALTGWYRGYYEVSGRTAGQTRFALHTGTNADGLLRSANGAFLERILANSGNDTVAIRTAVNFDGSVDNLKLFAETVDSAPQGVWAFYAVPRNEFGGAGPVSGPVTVTII